MPANRTAEGKARQRGRNANATRSGSSGRAKWLGNMKKRTFAEVERDLVHVTDIVADITHATTAADRSMILTVMTGKEYAYDVLDAIQASGQSFVMIRVYTVPRERFFDEDGDDGDQG